jgi:hypothetical protein
MFSTSSSLGFGGADGDGAWDGIEVDQAAGCDRSGLSDAADICSDTFDAGCAASEVGVCWPEAVVEAGFEGARDGIVWLSLVSRRDVMITWGTW